MGKPGLMLKRGARFVATVVGIALLLVVATVLGIVIALALAEGYWAVTH